MIPINDMLNRIDTDSKYFYITVYAYTVMNIEIGLIRIEVYP